MAAAKSLVVGALLGLVGFFLTGIAFAFLYLFIMGTVLGQRGWENVGAIVTFPMLGIIMGAVWIAAEFYFARRKGRVLSSGRAALYGALLGTLVGMSMSGFRGFTMAGGSTLFNYYTLGIGAVGAWLHRLLAGRALR